MVNLIRRFQQPLMIFITIVIIIAFVVLYNMTSTTGRGVSGQVGKIYGRNVDQTELIRGSKRFEIASVLQMEDYLVPLAMPAQTPDAAKENYLWNSIVLRKEADEMGIKPTDAEVEAYVMAMPVFQGPGGYDGKRFENFVANFLSPRGMSEDQLFELIRDHLKVQKITSILGATAAAAPSEVRRAFEKRNQKTEASFIRFELADAAKDIQVTEEDIKKTFDERTASLNTEEKRKVKYVAFTPPATEKPLVGKELAEAMQAPANAAEEFSVQMTEANANFDELAAKLQPTPEKKYVLQGPKVSAEFEQNAPPTELGSSDDVAAAAFKLSKESPNSDVITMDKAYYILQLAEIIPPRPLTYEEAKPKLETELKDERSREALTLKATATRNTIAAQLKEKKSFEEAAKAAGVQAQKFPAFSPSEPKMDQPDARPIMSRAFEMKEGELSDPVPTGTAMLLVHVDKRLPVEEERFEKEKQNIAQSLTRERSKALFMEWLRNRRSEANLQRGRMMS